MSADLHLHVLTPPATEDDLARFNNTTLGSKYFDQAPYDPESYCSPYYERISVTPNIWIGSVSWLKAALFENGQQFVPEPVRLVVDLIGEELPRVTPELIDALCQALAVPSTANTFYQTAQVTEVRAFLEAHQGLPLFTISW